MLVLLILLGPVPVSVCGENRSSPRTFLCVMLQRFTFSLLLYLKLLREVIQLHGLNIISILMLSIYMFQALLKQVMLSKFCLKVSRLWKFEWGRTDQGSILAKLRLRFGGQQILTDVCIRTAFQKIKHFLGCRTSGCISCISIALKIQAYGKLSIRKKEKN